MQQNMNYPFEIQYNTQEMLSYQDDICRFIQRTSAGLFQYCSKIILIREKNYILRTLAYRVYVQSQQQRQYTIADPLINEFKLSIGNNDPRKYVEEDHPQTLQFIQQLLGQQNDEIPTQANFNLLMQNTQINFAVQEYYSQQDQRIFYDQNNLDFSFILYIFLFNNDPYILYSSKNKDQEIRQFGASALKSNNLQMNNFKINNFQTNNQQDSLFNTAYENSEPQNFRMTLQKAKILPVILKIQNNQVKKECDICCEEYPIENEIKLNCQHSYHKECLINTLIMEIQNHQSFMNLKCINPICNQQIDGVLLKSLIPQQYDKLVKNIVEQKSNATCPKCATLMIIDQEIKGSIQQQKIKCSHCCFEICSLCNQQFHEKKENETCPHLFSQILDIFKGQPIIVCPYCNTISTKDEKCDKVDCGKCKQQLCAACSCDRIPTAAHGNHYHRKGCKNYAEWIDEKTKKPVLTEEFNEKTCKRCQETKKPCKRPMDLETYQKLKGFFNHQNLQK
ncbi:hypothetical protein pb186bvf_005463 [Paramecium bursaria]